VLQRRKKTWAELTRTQRRLVAAGAVAQIALQVAALWDLRRRPADELRGRKAWWTAASFVNIIGPLAYFVVGRRCGRTARPGS